MFCVADHTLGINMTIAAKALGAVALEKHFTLDSTEFGPDHSASIEPEELKTMVKGIREVEAGLGVTNRVFSDKEINQRKVHRTSIVVNSPIKKGDIFTKENLTIKRPGIGIMPKHYEKIIGKKSNKDLSTETLLAWNDV